MRVEAGWHRGLKRVGVVRPDEGDGVKSSEASHTCSPWPACLIGLLWTLICSKEFRVVKNDATSPHTDQPDLIYFASAGAAREESHVPGVAFMEYFAGCRSFLPPGQISTLSVLLLFVYFLLEHLYILKLFCENLLTYKAMGSEQNREEIPGKWTC